MEEKFKEKFEELDKYYEEKDEEISSISTKGSILGRLKHVKSKIEKFKNLNLTGYKIKDIEEAIKELKDEIDKIYEDCEPSKEDPYVSPFI